MPGRRAGTSVAVYARVQCREPKTGKRKVQFSSKTKHFAHQGILFMYLCPEQKETQTILTQNKRQMFMKR